MFTIGCTRFFRIATFLWLHIFAKAVESATPHFSHEHKELALVSPDEANDLNMPEGYKVAIGRALELGLFKQK